MINQPLSALFNKVASPLATAALHTDHVAYRERWRAQSHLTVTGCIQWNKNKGQTSRTNIYPVDTASLLLYQL